MWRSLARSEGLGDRVREGCCGFLLTSFVGGILERGKTGIGCGLWDLDFCVMYGSMVGRAAGSEAGGGL